MLVGCLLDHAWLEHWRLASATLLFLSILSLAWVLRVGRRLADVVTLLRGFALVPLLAVTCESPWVVWGLAVCVSLLDLADGVLARRLGATAAGAVLDMECDQLTVAGFALLVVAAGGGAHVLLLPLMRPGFVMVAWWQGLPATDPKPIEGDNRRGKLVCAAVMVALLLALLPGVSAWGRDTVTWLAVLLLLWSFSSDARYLLQRRRAARGLHGSP